MAQVGISELAFELGQPIDAIQGWAAYQQIDEDFLARMQRNSVKTFRRARGKSPRELCGSAVDRVLENLQCDLSGFGGAIHFHSLHSSAPVFSTSYRTFLRDRGFPDDAFFFSVSQQRCIGFHLALKLAQARLEANPYLGPVLLFGGDIAIDEQQRNIDGLAIESDAASAAIVSRSGRWRVLSTEIRTEGAYFQHDKPYDVGRYQITAFREIMKLVDTVLSDAGIGPDDLEAVITHNGNLDMWGRILRNFRIPEEKHFRDNIADVGHTNCSDFPINLKTLLDNRQVRQGAHILVLTIAYGRSFGCTLIRT